LTQGAEALDPKLQHAVLSFCDHAARPYEVKAAFVRNDYASILPTPGTVVQVVAVIRDYAPRLMNYLKAIDECNVSVLGVDQWVFERDVERGFLGEALAGGLVFPYSVLKNEEYLRGQEIDLKKRLIVELLESLVLDFPELSYELHIKPEYFMYETMLTRGRLFPPTLYAFVELVTEPKHKEKIQRLLSGFLEAETRLERDGIVYIDKGYTRISRQFVEETKKRKAPFTDLFRTGQRALFTAALGIFPQIFDAVMQNRGGFLRLQRAFVDESKIMQGIEDPENYVYIPTATGLVTLGNRMDIAAFARKALSADRNAQARIKNIGGILNDVYAVELLTKNGPKKVVVKRFRDWSNFKWFPLTLWAVGTRTFAVASISRLEREWAINRLLESKGFAVPKLLHVSPGERLIVMEYVEGSSLSRVVKHVFSAKTNRDVKEDLDVIGKVGTLFGQVHSLNIALGDTKPENILIGKNSEVYLMDFEQASRNGDPNWDVAEFIYYSGHYASPLIDVYRVQQFAEAFIKGYLASGGKSNVIKSASSAKYTKVFSVFVFPHVMLTLSNICRRVEESEA
jgi:tRNA A-37 threonylcarbamoyl transferase component Bud32